MGMFDKPQYLTGPTGFVSPGETFWLHNARLDGTATVSGQVRDQVKMLVSKDKDSKKEVVFTSGAGIVGQVRRMDDDDRSRMPQCLRLDTVPSKHGNPTNVLTPADQPEPSQAADDDIPF